MGCLLSCCCGCNFCEPKDDWLITNEIRDGERGAGTLSKRGKNANVPVWSRRFFVLTDYKLSYYLENNRGTYKGEIVLAGARAFVSAARTNRRKAWYFTISHPQCGSRELCAETQNRQGQWIELINDLSQALQRRDGAMYGKLFKQGGIRKNTWQERWCIVCGNNMDYFDAATDNQPKGTLDLLGASYRAFVKSDKHCIEITPGTKIKKDKKYVFATPGADDSRRWMIALEKAALPPQCDEEGNEVDPDFEGRSDNPIHNGGEGSATGGSLMQSFSVNPSFSDPKEMCGYLMKKSPQKLVGWQKRWFKLNTKGDLLYFKTEDSIEPLGVIMLKDIVLSDTNELEVNPHSYKIKIKTASKDYVLKAADYEEARNWADAIESKLCGRESLGKAPDADAEAGGDSDTSI